MSTFPYALPVELIERIIKLSFVPSGRRDLPPSSPPSTSLLSVSKAVRLLALPFFFEVVSIRRQEDWQTFFDPSSGIFVVGEEGAKRWGWVKELVVPLDLPPLINTQYKLGEPSYCVPLAIPSSKRITLLRYLPSPATNKRIDAEREAALVDLLFGGEDPLRVDEMRETAAEGYEADVDDGARRALKGGSEAFLARREGQEWVKGLLEDHVQDVLHVLRSNFFHYTLPTQLTPQSTILPENDITTFDPDGMDEHGTEAEPGLVFPPTPRFKHHFSTKLTIVRTCEPQPRWSGEEMKVECRLFEMRKRWKTKGPAVLEGFPLESLEALKGWLEREKGEESIKRWKWRTEKGGIRELGNLNQRE